MSLMFRPDEKNLAPLSPTRDFEVFVSKIPQSVSEQELISMFEKYGNIYGLRLVKKNRGSKNYAFVRFTERGAVRDAILRWNGYQIRRGHLIYVCKSVENKNLVLCGLPRNLSSSDIYYKVTSSITGLQGVDVYPPRFGRGANSGMAVLRFETHTCASIAKKVLNKCRNRLWNHVWNRPLYVEWHTPGLLTDECVFQPTAPAPEGVVPGLVEVCSERRAEAGSNCLVTARYHDMASETVFYTEVSNIVGVHYGDGLYWSYGDAWSYESNRNSCTF